MEGGTLIQVDLPTFACTQCSILQRSWNKSSWDLACLSCCCTAAWDSLCKWVILPCLIWGHVCRCVPQVEAQYPWSFSCRLGPLKLWRGRGLTMQENSPVMSVDICEVVLLCYNISQHSKLHSPEDICLQPQFTASLCTVANKERTKYLTFEF